MDRELPHQDEIWRHFKNKLYKIVAKSHNIPVTLFCDTNHVLKSDYSEVKIIGAGADAVDFAPVNSSRAGDIVVTQDYGVAAMALARGAYAINQDGGRYTNENIEGLLAKRHFIKKMRNATHKHHLKGPRKRTVEDDEKFTQVFEQLLDKVIDLQ